MNKIAGSILWVAAAIIFHAAAVYDGRSGDATLGINLGGIAFLVIGFIFMLTDDKPQKYAAPPAPRETKRPANSEP